MKRVPVILAVAAVVCASGVASAAIVKTYAFGDVVTRSTITDTVNGDATGWSFGNCQKGFGAGAAPAGGGWGPYNTPWPGADAGLIGIDRTQLQAEIDAHGGVNGNWQVHYIIPLRVASQASVILGIFKADNDPNAIWIGDPGNSRPRATSVDAANTKWTSGGVQYSQFEQMVEATGRYQETTGTLVTNALGATADSHVCMCLVIPMDKSIVQAYLNDASFIGFFFSAVDPNQAIRGYGGDQWPDGVGCQSLQITPEPATLSLLALGGMLIARRRRIATSVAAVLIMVGVLAGSNDRASAADVFNMGGTRNPTTGQWTGSASLEFVTVGDPGNAADAGGYVGSINYTYQMGTFDVTAAQYCRFLDAVAAADPYGLYNPAMADVSSSKIGCGISRNGDPGRYTYSVIGGRENYPANYLSWGDAARFANWLNNGQPTGPQGPGTTEIGSYTLNGATSDSALIAIHRNPGATYMLPNLNEWYKSGYYKGGSADAGYWLYATQSDSRPSNVLSSTGTNNANYYGGSSLGFTDPVNYLTPVGAFARSPGPYGTFDQAGNVWQWNETASGSRSYLWGGSYNYSYGSMKSTYGSGDLPTAELASTGFRVAMVPEPATLCLLALGGLLVARRRRA